jgi:p-aminobenzoyl-glutamate transporter AbgT
MEVVITAAQFVASCLALGLGLYVAVGAAQELYRRRMVALPGAVTTAALGGALILLGGGAYAAFLALPL